jgi:hypothetical protein
VQGRRRFVLSAFLAALVAGGAVCPERARATSGTSAGSRAPGVNWHLGSGFYPPGTTVVMEEIGSNSVLDSLFGDVHRSRYDTLARFDDRGWIQVARDAAKTKGHSSRVLTWSYGVSVYPSGREAANAVADLKPELQPLSIAGIQGGSTQFAAKSLSITFAALSVGPITVEQRCAVKKVDYSQLRAKLGRYCSRQLLALARLATEAGSELPASTATSVAAPTSPSLASTGAATLGPTSTTFTPTTDTPGTVGAQASTGGLNVATPYGPSPSGTNTDGPRNPTVAPPTTIDTPTVAPEPKTDTLTPTSTPDSRYCSGLAICTVPTPTTPTPTDTPESRYYPTPTPTPWVPTPTPTMFPFPPGE